MSFVFPERIQIDRPGQFGKVAVLMGGSSAEREVSLVTGKAVLEALRSRNIDAQPLDPSEHPLSSLGQRGFERVWIALHGRGGEDGVTQGALEAMGMPYTGSGVLGSALSMDKLRSKQLFNAVGLDTPPYKVLHASEDLMQAEKKLGWPMIVKPANEGSSVGMARAENMQQLRAAWEQARDYDDCVLAETWITGAEYTASILQGAALPLIRIQAAGIFYDYQAKYHSDETRYFCPCGLDVETEARFRESAMRAFASIAASGWGRVDFMLDEHGRAMFLEVNTVPGMTSHSLVPMAAKVAGLEFDELAWRVLETSFRQGDDIGAG
jgi:D-alanine-D-alanine ligase